MEKCVAQGILVEANLHLAVKLQSELITRAILQVASILRKKIKVEIESKFYGTRHKQPFFVKNTKSKDCLKTMAS